MPISIRTRLTGAFTLVIFAVLLLANVALSVFSRRLATQRADHVLREASKAAVHSFGEEWDEYEEDGPKRDAFGVSRFDATKPILTAIEHTRHELSEDHVDIVVIDNRTGGVVRATSSEVGLAWPPRVGSGWRFYRTQLVKSGSSTERYSYTIVTGIPWFHIADGLRTQDYQVAELCLFFVMLFGVGTWIVVGHTLRPIARLAEQARVFRDAPESQRVQLSAPSPDSEVVVLVSTLNLLLDSIAESAEAKSRFYTAASHELRTPLHVLGGQVELTLSRPRTAEAYEAAMSEVQRQTDRLTTIIESLLLLNRLDRDGRNEPAGSVVVDAIVNGQIATVEPLLAARHLTIERAGALGAGETPKAIEAPELHVEIMLRNLIENAAKYASPGTEISWSLQELTGGAALFRIRNETAAIAPEEFGRLCEPFYRPDASRSTRTGGNGLGLSICLALADANGWTLTLTQDDNALIASVMFYENAR